MIVSLVCLQEQRKQSFLTLPKENQPRFDLSKSSLIFFTNPHFVLLILIVLCCISSMRPHSSLITGACATHTSYILRRNGLHIWQSAEVRKKSIYNILNKDIFLTKMHRFTTDGLYSPPEPCEAHFYYGCACLFDVFWTVWTKTPIYSHSNA